MFHPSSLVDAASHSPALLELIQLKISKQTIGESLSKNGGGGAKVLTMSFIEYVVDCTVDTVAYAMGRPSSSSRRSEHSKFTTFVSNVLTRAEVTMPTLLSALVYIDRAKPHLHIGLEQWALERVFLGALIVASKYLNDSTLKNVHWALCTGVFGKRDVGRIEREYLDVLNFELGISEDDLLSHHQGLLNATLGARSTKTAISSLPRATSRHHSRSSSSLPSLDSSPTESSDDSDSDSAPRTPDVVSLHAPQVVTSTSSSSSSSAQPAPTRKSAAQFAQDIFRSIPRFST